MFIELWQYCYVLLSSSANIIKEKQLYQKRHSKLLRKGPSWILTQIDLCGVETRRKHRKLVNKQHADRTHSGTLVRQDWISMEWRGIIDAIIKAVVTHWFYQGQWPLLLLKYTWLLTTEIIRLFEVKYWSSRLLYKKVNFSQFDIPHNGFRLATCVL